MKIAGFLAIMLIIGLAPAAAQVERPTERIRIEPTTPVTAQEETPVPVHHLWGDLDGDGLKDLFVLDQKGNVLFKNSGDGGFDDVTALAFPDGAGHGGTGFLGDYNGDKRLDLFLFHEEGFTLFRNRGKLSFRDVTESLGLPDDLKGAQIQLEDYDSDGYGDLLVKAPEGDRIFRNREGSAFGEVDLAGKRLSTSGKIPPVQDPGGWSTPDLGSSMLLSDEIRFLNDNSPGSVGLGIPEVEGGNDGSTMNDIVDNTVTGDDIQDTSLTGSDIMDDSVSPEKVIGKAATLSGDQSFDSGTLFIDTATHRIGVGTTSPGDADLHVIGSSEHGCRVENTASSGKKYGIYGESVSTTGRGVFGKASASTGTAIGIVGESNSKSGIGVFGFTDNLSGSSTGIYGWIDSDSGQGVLGHADAASGQTIGVEGSCQSTSGTGVEGYASAATGDTTGVHGWCNSNAGTGVLGKALSTSGSTYGVYGEAHSDSGTGVYGKATRTTGNTFGVVGESNSDSGIGVLGFTTSSSGSDIAVYGWSDSTSGAGVLGHADAVTGNTVGVEGTSESESGKGVAGFANASTGDTAGVEGWSESTTGKGVYGVVNATTGVNSGIYGWSKSDQGFGVYGYASHASGKTTAGVMGSNYSKSGTGVSGRATAPSGFTYGVRGTADSPSGFGVYSHGDFGASGTKSFIQPHPRNPSKQIRFVCLEGNESGTYFRGSSRLEGGRAVIEVPESFRLVTEEEGLTVQVTPRGLIQIGVEEADLERIVVLGSADEEFDYFVNGVRRGFAEFEPMEENHAWVPVFRDRPYGTQYPEALRLILVENEILKPDFTPNMKTAKKLGWTLRDFEEENPRDSDMRSRKTGEVIHDPDRWSRGASDRREKKRVNPTRKSAD